ncbi:MAG: hypothetical protein HUU48_11035 [Flavobacteriales bacterium]|nr:hypothetical protein [Flavobacteriales bacterium]
MKNVGLWLDTHKAYLITLTGLEVTIERIDSEVETRERIPGEGDDQTRFKGGFGTQFVDHERTKEARLNNQKKEYFHRLTAEIINADNIYIFGPAETKIDFKNHLESNKELFKKVVAIETADSMTENQLKAKVLAYFSVK